MRWCAMCIFLYLKFYNFIKGIMRTYIVFLKNLVQIFITCNRTEYLSLNKLASKVWKKNCPNFFIQHKARGKSDSFSDSLLVVIASFFIHSLNKFVFLKKCLRVADFLQLDALYASIRHDPRSKYNRRKGP